ncbi:hypothetical protein K435DRAFT_844073 [Dendrothele bispora CBS 962.96]|uniref:Uncharacterized protein n=1 Tax=Dendrothele bispora (strain CBS 962.96) TaxID=1314807 RepID=A0A4S8L4C1_DENBC|nr:hypothetical protein K435DRAFT_844073 [Dendrothele bispora CBS 962.96]
MLSGPVNWLRLSSVYLVWVLALHWSDTILAPAVQRLLNRGASESLDDSDLQTFEKALNEETDDSASPALELNTSFESTSITDCEPSSELGAYPGTDTSWMGEMARNQSRFCFYMNGQCQKGYQDGDCALKSDVLPSESGNKEARVYEKTRYSRNMEAE